MRALNDFLMVPKFEEKTFARCVEGCVKFSSLFIFLNNLLTLSLSLSYSLLNGIF